MCPHILGVPREGVLRGPHGEALVVLGRQHGVLGARALEELGPLGRVEKGQPDRGA